MPRHQREDGQLGTSPNTPASRRRILIRRAVLVALVALSLGLFTGYFREGSGGPLHAVQSAFGAAAAPLESFASNAVSPLRNGWNWMTSLIDARNRAAQLERTNQVLQQEVIAARDDRQALAEARRLAGIRSLLPNGYARVTADVIGRSPTAWYDQATLDVGTADGVVANSPVVAAADGPRPVLVGSVISTTSHSAVVSWITNQGMAAGAYVLDGSPVGVVTAIGDGQLALDRVPRAFRVRRGDIVMTSGFSTGTLASMYPRGLPIGSVQSVGPGEVDNYRSVQVQPLVDVRTLSSVVVLAPRSAEARRRAAG